MQNKGYLLTYLLTYLCSASAVTLVISDTLTAHFYLLTFAWWPVVHLWRTASELEGQCSAPLPMMQMACLYQGP